VELRADSNLLHSAVYQSSATIDSPLGDTSAASLSALAGSYGDASVAGDAVAAAMNRCVLLLPCFYFLMCDAHCDQSLYLGVD